MSSHDQTMARQFRLSASHSSLSSFTQFCTDVSRRAVVASIQIDSLALNPRDLAASWRRSFRVIGPPGNGLPFSSRSERRLHWKIGRAHVGTPVTNAHLVCRLLLEKKKHIDTKKIKRR